MDHICVYLNQRASNGNLDYWKKKIESSLFRSQLNFRTPNTLNELKSSLKEDVLSRPKAIISVGGDGTVNTLIQELAHSDVGLLVVPGGTANDLASELGNRRNIKKVIHSIRSKETTKMDLISVNGKLMATNGGIGFGAKVAERINKIRKKYPIFKKMMKFTGKSIYSFFVAQELMAINFKRHHIKIVTDQNENEYYACAVLINNQPMLAGTFPVAPHTSNNDGKFNLTILTHPTRKELIQCIINVIQGRSVADDKHFLTLETNELKIDSMDDEKIDFFGDGEILATERSFEIKIVPDSLRVFSKVHGENLFSPTSEVTLQ